MALQEELEDDYVSKETSKWTLVGMGLGGVTGAGVGLAIGAESALGSALIVGGSVASAPIVVPAAIGAAVIGAGACAVSNVMAKNAKIGALEKQGLQKEIEGKKVRQLAATKDLKQLKAEQKGSLFVLY